MLVFHELDLLVLRPFVKKRASGSLIIRAGFIPKFRKHLHEGPKNTRKNENSKFEIYFLTYKPRKKGILKGASPDGKNKVFEF